MVEISKYQGLRQNVFHSYLQQYDLHSRCLALLADITERFGKEEPGNSWDLKMRTEWHERMRFSIETYLTKRYRAQKTYVEDFIAGVNIRVHSEAPQGGNMKRQLLSRIEMIRDQINGLLSYQTLPRQVDDMMSDHKYILSSLYEA